MTKIKLCVLQVRAEITSKEKEEEDMMEKVQKEAKYDPTFKPPDKMVQFLFKSKGCWCFP